jgi:hypothetical protein
LGTFGIGGGIFTPYDLFGHFLGRLLSPFQFPARKHSSIHFSTTLICLCQHRSPQYGPNQKSTSENLLGPQPKHKFKWYFWGCEKEGKRNLSTHVRRRHKKREWADWQDKLAKICVCVWGQGGKLLEGKRKDQKEGQRRWT